MSAQGAVSGTAPTSGRGVPKACATEGIEGRGRASDGRPRPHAAIDPAKIRGSQVVGYIKGKSAIHLARVYGERKRNFVGQHFWARGFFVNTVCRDEEAIRAYIRNQAKEDQRLEQMNLWR
jgi:putative transposase